MLKVGPVLSGLFYFCNGKPMSKNNIGALDCLLTKHVVEYLIFSGYLVGQPYLKKHGVHIIICIFHRVGNLR